MNQPDIDPARLLRRLRDLSCIGRTPEGGITRPGFSQAATDATSFVADEARTAGLCPAIDAAGNLLISRPGQGKPRRTLLIGSHLDTVINGGWLDGAYGVVAALETLQIVSESRVDLGFDLAAVAFANEEGALFPQAFWGSMVLAGRLDTLPEHPADYHGRPLRGALARAGGNLDALDTAIWVPGRLLGYIELHIEQGPVLEASGTPIGVVDAISGRTVIEAEFSGRAAHAGTTPMAQRSDALLGAAHVTLAVNQLPARGLCRVATVGLLDVSPNSANTIAGSARITIDLRDADPSRLRAAENAVIGEITSLGAGLGLQAQCQPLAHSDPAATSHRLRELITGSAHRLGLPTQELPSGAGHDAQILATVTPIGMIFVPSIGGASHVPEEDTAPADLVAGARVLLATVLSADA